MKNAKLIKMAILGGAAFFATSCATAVSEDQCLAVDWGDKGYSDGINGLERSELDDYLEGCSKYAVNVDRARYLEGYERGAADICTYEGGLALAKQGKGVESSCAETTVAEFNRGHAEGARSYCTYSKGFSSGKVGRRTYESVCEYDGLEDYQRGFADGHNRYQYERAADSRFKGSGRESGF